MRLVGLGCVLAVLLAAAAGCGLLPAAEAPAPEGSPATSASAPASPSTPSAKPSVEAARGGPVGMDVRYLDQDGTVKELKVKDFRR